jgi:hypothetical protein
MKLELEQSGTELESLVAGSVALSDWGRWKRGIEILSDPDLRLGASLAPRHPGAPRAVTPRPRWTTSQNSENKMVF